MNNLEFLKLAYSALNEVPNTKLTGTPGFTDTYRLAGEIGRFLKEVSKEYVLVLTPTPTSKNASCHVKVDLDTVCHFLTLSHTNRKMYAARNWNIECDTRFSCDLFKASDDGEVCGALIKSMIGVRDAKKFWLETADHCLPIKELHENFPPYYASHFRFKDEKMFLVYYDYEGKPFEVASIMYKTAVQTDRLIAALNLNPVACPIKQE